MAERLNEVPETVDDLVNLQKYLIKVSQVSVHSHMTPVIYLISIHVVLVTLFVSVQ